MMPDAGGGGLVWVCGMICRYLHNNNLASLPTDIFAPLTNLFALFVVQCVPVGC
mgnify:CR=1 FL=1